MKFECGVENFSPYGEGADTGQSEVMADKGGAKTTCSILLPAVPGACRPLHTERRVPFIAVVAFALTFLSLTACTSTPMREDSVVPQLTFTHLVDVPVNVGVIEFSSNTKRGSQPWDITNDVLATPPDRAMRQYLTNRYKAVGDKGQLFVELKKADLMHKSVPQKNWFLSQVSFANNDQYTFEIMVHLAGQYLSGVPNKEKDIRFVRTVEIPPHVTQAYREQYLQRLLEEVVRDFDDAMMRTLAHDFGMVDPKNIPVHVIDVKTDIPEIETEIIKQDLFNQ